MRLVRPFTLVVALAPFFATSGCTALVDRNTTQCSTDSDCAHFGGHPICQNRVCVDSGLGPVGCVVGPPQGQLDYLNSCSAATCVRFDDCARLGLCAAETSLPAPTTPSNPAIPPLVNPVATPTQACTDGASGVIYMYGTSDFAPMLRAVQPLLSAGSPPYRAVYQNASSCAGVASVFDPTKSVMKDPAAGATPNYAFYFDDNGQQVNCFLNTAGATIEIGVSNLFSDTCSTDTTSYVSGDTVSDYTGPVVPFVLSVPESSTQMSISVEALYVAFGLGGTTGGVDGTKDALPWVDPTYYFIRSASSGSTVLTSLLINVPRSQFWGIDRLSTGNVRDSLLVSTNAEASVGILSIDYADTNRGNLRSLFLQASGQLCGYLPDSSGTSFDKMNVRDGHYPLWGYVHFFTPVGPGGVPADAAKAFVSRFAISRLDQGLIDNIIGASLVPQCAMKVARKSDIGDYASTSGLKCGCYFDFKTKGKSDCAPCQSDMDCSSATPSCNYGYCETM